MPSTLTPLTTREKINGLSDELYRLAGDAEDAAQLHDEEIRELQGKLETAQEEASDAQTELESKERDYSTLADAVHLFFDTIDGSPVWEDKGLENLRDCARNLGIIS